MLVVEDLHWADRSTLDLVSLLASNTRHLPVLLVATYRATTCPAGTRSAPWPPS